MNEKILKLANDMLDVTSMFQAVMDIEDWETKPMLEPMLEEMRKNAEEIKKEYE